MLFFIYFIKRSLKPLSQTYSPNASQFLFYCRIPWHKGGPSDGTTSHHFDFPTMDKENCKKT